jgi:hypothetical protein
VISGQICYKHIVVHGREGETSLNWNSYFSLQINIKDVLFGLTGWTHFVRLPSFFLPELGTIH